MKRKALAWIVALTMVMVVLSGCGSGTETATEEKGDSKVVTGETGYPVTVVDDYDNEVTLEKEPTKIVTLGPAQTEIVCELDGTKRLVGRSEIDDYPAEVADIQSVGAYYEPNVEMIIGLAPELIISTNYMDDAVKAQLEASGAKVYMCYDRGIDETEDNIKDIGLLINQNDVAADTIASIEEAREEISQTLGIDVEGRKVMIDLGDYYSAGPGSLLDDMLKELHATNIAADTGTEWPQLSAEQIIAADPDVYLSFYPTVEDIKAMPGFDHIAAVKNDQIYFYDMYSEEASMIQRSGPRIGDGLSLLAQAIYPELFQ